MTTTSSISENYAWVGNDIDAACRRSGRDRASVKLVAVTKYAPLDAVRGLLELGLRDLGESRPQQLTERAALLPADVRWHLIGHLQRNKVRSILPVCVLTHSVDSLRLLDRMERLAGETQRRPHILLEVNVAGEASKHGFSIDELQNVWADVIAHRHVAVDGLMTMAPYSDDPEQARPIFRRLRQLRDELNDRALQSGATDPTQAPLRELSMGMSGDFEVAIEEGATIVRIGSRLFADG